MSGQQTKKLGEEAGERSESQGDTAEPAASARLPEKIVGAKYVRLLENQLKQLRGETGHGNQHLSIDRVCKRTLSDSNTLVDPDRLVPMITALRGQLSRKRLAQPGANDDLNELLKRTIAVDGTFLHAVADVAWAVANSNNHGAKRHRARLDPHVNVSTWLPENIVVPDSGQSEADSSIPITPGVGSLKDSASRSRDPVCGERQTENGSADHKPAECFGDDDCSFVSTPMAARHTS